MLKRQWFLRRFFRNEQKSFRCREIIEEIYCDLIGQSGWSCDATQSSRLIYKGPRMDLVFLDQRFDGIEAFVRMPNGKMIRLDYLLLRYEDSMHQTNYLKLPSSCTQREKVMLQVYESRLILYKYGRFLLDGDSEEISKFEQWTEKLGRG